MRVCAAGTSIIHEQIPTATLLCCDESHVQASKPCFHSTSFVRPRILLLTPHHTLGCNDKAGNCRAKKTPAARMDYD